MNPINRVPNTSIGTMIPIGALSPAGFAVLTKNPDSSFKLMINSSDLSITGISYKF